MKEVKSAIVSAQEKLRDLLKPHVESGMTIDMYQRFLSMEYYLTNGVQKHFYHIAGSPQLAHKKTLKAWLVNFANEEEFHHKLAKNDLQALGRELLPIGLRAKLWWAYFNSIIADEPYVRLGTACILENISAGAARETLGLVVAHSNFITPKNSTFLTVHQHGPELPHGDQILAIIEQSNLSEREYASLLQGNAEGTVLYLDQISYVINGP